MKQVFSIFFLVTFFMANAQKEDEVSGTVKDNGGESIEVGDVLLLTVEDETLVQYTTILDGKFFFKEIPTGDYVLRISCLGYKEWEQKIGVSDTMSIEIVLDEETTDLEGVEISVAKNPISYANGNLKVDVQNPIFSAIPDPLEVLSKLPNVQVAANRESISVLGKGNPLIYLGNQRIGFEEFMGLAVSSIASIELINNPSPKYEAEGRAVLLITRKVNSGDGITYSANQTASFRRNYNNYLGLNGNYTKNKWSIRGNLAYNVLGQWESNGFEFRIPEIDVITDYLVLVPNNDRKEFNMGIGMQYQINDDDYFSVNMVRNLQTNDSPIEAETFLQEGTNADTILSDTENDNTKDYFSANVNFNKKITKDFNLFTGIQYSSFVQNLDTEVSNNTNNSGFILDELRKQEYDIRSLAFRMDFEKTFTKDMTLEFGMNISGAQAEAFTMSMDLINDETSIVDFEYEESLYAGYTNFAGKISTPITYNLGVRLEHNQVKSAVEADATPLVEREMTNLFPKAGLNIALDSTKTLSINYGRSIVRPNYSRASSISVFINPFLEGAGNINLLPKLANELAVNYQWKNKSINLTYFKSKNPLFFTISFDREVQRAVLSQVNLEAESGFNLGLNLPFSHKKWTSTNSINFNYIKVSDATAIQRRASPYLYVYSDQQFQLGKNTRLGFGGWLVTESQEGIFERNAMVVLNATLSKTIFKNVQCTLRLNDITRAMNFEERYAIDGVEADGVYYADGRELAFSVKYSFGNQKQTKFKNKDVDENLGRIN